MTLTKKKVFSAILSVLLTVVLMFSSLAMTQAKATTTASFEPRLSAPAYNNKYYYSSLNPFYATGYGMPNCVAYAYGRAYEILGTKPNLCTSSAHKWWNYNKSGGYYPYGSEPKLGAIACWTRGGSGHVAVVEAINGNQVTVSQSHSSGTVFNTYTLTAGNESSYAGYFQGYIYILEGLENISYDKIVAANGYQTGNYQVKTGGYDLRVRNAAGTNGEAVSQIPDGSTLYVSEINGDWGKVSYDGKTGYINLAYCSFQGMANYDGDYYKFNGSKVDENYTGLVKSKGTWYYIKKGVYDKTYNGFVTNDNGTWKVTNGKVTMRDTGFYKYNNGNYYFVKSKLQDSTTLVKDKGAWYYIEQGKKVDFTGLVDYDGAMYYVQNGKVTLQYNGKVTYNGKTVTVVNSKVAS